MKRDTVQYKTKKKKRPFWHMITEQFKKPNTPTHPDMHHFSLDDKRLVHYIRNQQRNGFSNEAIINHLTKHHYTKKQIVPLIDFITAVDQRKEEISSLYTKLIVGLYLVLIVFFYLLSAALLIPASQLFVTFSPIFFSTIFALGIFSSRNIENKQIAWFVPLLAVGLFVYLGLDSDVFTVNIGSVVLVNMLFSYLLLALLYYLFITKNKKLLVYDDDELAFIQLTRRRQKNKRTTKKKAHSQRTKTNTSRRT